MMKSNMQPQKGFSIVELMVTLVINSLVLIAVVQLFTQNKSNYQQQDTLARMQENGRFAMEYITRDIRYADFWGCVPDPTNVTNNVVGAAAAQFANGGIGGQEAAGPTAPDAGYNVGADSFSISRATNVSGQVVADMATTADVITIGFDPTGSINPGDTLTISDCQRGDIFTVTAITGVDTDGDAVDDQWQIAHAQNDAGGNPVNTSDDLSFNYSTLASLFTRASGVAYAIGTDATTGEPALTRNGQVIIPGVETMQIVYGEDTSVPIDGVVDRYIPANSVTDFNNVISVRIALLVRAEEARNQAPIAYTLPGIGTFTPTDNRSRRVFTATSTIRNRTDTTTI